MKQELKKELMKLLKKPRTFKELLEKTGWTRTQVKYWLDILQDENLIGLAVRSTIKKKYTSESKGGVYYRKDYTRNITFENK